MTPVLRSAATTQPIPVTVDTFKDAKTQRESKSDDSSAFRDQEPPDPCDG